MRISSNQIYQQGIESILQKQTRLAELQEQIASGKRLLRPSDDPAAMARALEIQQTLEQTEQYQRNIGEARSRLEIQETVLVGVNEVFLRARELTIQANTATTGPAERATIAVEIRQLAEGLRSLANTRDGNGDYIFAGFQGRDQPFQTVQFGTESHVAYQGDQGNRFARIGADRQVQTSESGAEVFLKVPGAQALQVEANPANTGAVTHSPARVFDSTLATGDRYRIEFFNPPTQYVVLNETAGTVVQTGNYVPGARLQFDGIEISIDGAPGPLDQLFVEPGPNQDVFTTLDKLATTLEIASPASGNPAATTLGLDSALADLDSAIERTSEIRTRIGARMNVVDAQEIDNDAVLMQSERTLSRLQDLDLVEAISQLQQESANMEAAQATFVTLSRLSLFDFLR